MNRIGQNPYVSFFEKIKPLFIWLFIFYPHAKGTPIAYLLYCFIPQKVFRINGNIPWGVHFTSRVLAHKNIKVGRSSNPGLSNGCYIQGKNGIEIGDNLRMGPNVGLISANHDPENYDLWLKAPPIVIGHNVWIGMGSVILPGTQIGDNVIIGANSVVS